MAQSSRYPEHDIFAYKDDLESHLEEFANHSDTSLTAIGLLPDDKGRIVTFDRPAINGYALIPACLPQATLHVEDLFEDEKLEDGLTEVIAERFKLADDVEVEIIGSAYAVGMDNQKKPVTRVYVPILHHGIVDIEKINPTDSMRGMINIPREPLEILEILAKHDSLEGIRGQRSRAITRFAIDSYMSLVGPRLRDKL